MSEHFRPAPGSKAFQEVRRKPGTMLGVKQPQLKEPLEPRTEREAERGSHYLTERPTYNSPGGERIRLAGRGKHVFIYSSYNLLMQIDAMFLTLHFVQLIIVFYLKSKTKSQVSHSFSKGLYWHLFKLFINKAF